MSSKNQIDRILTGEAEKFFSPTLAPNSPTRDFIVNYILESLHDDNGKKSVALCFRGEYATLYYRCQKLLNIESESGHLIGKFDFRHSRFTANYREIHDRLLAMGVSSDFSDEDVPKGKSTSKRYVTFPLVGIGEEKLRTILDIFKGLIDDFVDPEKRTYAFDAKDHNRRKKNLEKDRQQQLWAHYFLNEELTYYDVEYTEPHADKKGVHGRFDLLGLKAEADGSYTLLLTELKSTREAVFNKKSGAKEHETDYKEYLDKGFGEQRKREACAVIPLYYQIFKKPLPEKLKDLTPDKIKRVQIKFVFSDTAIGAAKKFLPTDPRTVKVFLDDSGSERT